MSTAEGIEGQWELHRPSPQRGAGAQGPWWVISVRAGRELREESCAAPAACAALALVFVQEAHVCPILF